MTSYDIQTYLAAELGAPTDKMCTRICTVTIRFPVRATTHAITGTTPDLKCALAQILLVVNRIDDWRTPK